MYVLSAERLHSRDRLDGDSAMSVRVRCRCGQELHLSYGEWVYVLLGLVLLCLVVNSLALLLIYFHIERLAERIEPPAAVRDTSSEVPGEVEPTRGARENGAQKKPPDRSARASGSPPTKAPLAPESSAPEESSQRTPEVVDPQERGEESSAEPVSANAHVRPEEEGMTELREIVAAADEGGAAAPSDHGDAAAPSPSSRGLFADEAPLFRLLLLEQVPGGLNWRLSFLLDADTRIRRRALEKLTAYSMRVTATSQRFSSELSQHLLREVRASLGDREHGQRVLDELARLFPYAAKDPPTLSKSGVLSDFLDESRRLGEAFMGRPPVKAVRDSMRKATMEGLDCVLLVDVSQSMEGILKETWRQVAWLWPVLRWGLPGIRLGVVLYRDEVVAVQRFSQRVEEEIDRLKEVEAAGGGDVPEGLHLAIKESLSLGSFDWRRGAAKHLIVLADAPPPFRKQRGLSSLLRRARQQGAKTFELRAATSLGRLWQTGANRREAAELLEATHGWFTEGFEGADL